MIAHTAYFGDWRTQRWTKVHLVNEEGKPICGSSLGPNMEPQWCSVGPHLPYVECRKCRKMYEALEWAREEREKK